jgi:hypothetical protein
MFKNSKLLLTFTLVCFLVGTSTYQKESQSIASESQPGPFSPSTEISSQIQTFII